MKKKSLLGAALGATVLAATIGSVAYADPSGQPTYRQLAGVGSDTTQGVMNGLAQVVTSDGTPTGTKLLGSYDAVGSATISTKAAAACQSFARPNGSGAGQTELGVSMTPASARPNCVDFARSSSGVGGTTPVGTTFVPFAIDAVSYAVTSTSNIPRQLSFQDVSDIYHCLGDSSIKPLIPQSGSGTRKFWLKTLFGSETPNLAPYPCIKDTIGSTPIEEHNGKVLDDNSIVPISVAQWVSQAEGTIADSRGASVLGVIDSQLPFDLNTSFGVQREVYNVLPTASLSDATVQSVFKGASSKICTATATIQAYGFGIDPNCGSVTLTH